MRTTTRPRACSTCGASGDRPVLRAQEPLRPARGCVARARARRVGRSGIRQPRRLACPFVPAGRKRILVPGLRDVGARRSRHALRRGAAGRHQDREGRQGDRHVPRHSQPHQEWGRAGSAVRCIPSRVRPEPPVLRRLHRYERRHARRRIQVGQRRRPARERAQLLFVKQPYPNHNGGQLQFDKSGYLYVGMGDGGSGGDPENRAQNLQSRLGKLLRINPTRAGSAWQIVGYGVRNPWRFSFDRATGDLWIGDVGQDQWEEVDYVPQGARQARELRLEPLRGTLDSTTRRKPYLHKGDPWSAGGVYSHDRRLLGHRRLRVPRASRCRRRTGATSSATTAAARCGASRRGRVARLRSRRSARSRASPRSARTGTASSTPSAATARSTSFAADALFALRASLASRGNHVSPVCSLLSVLAAGPYHCSRPTRWAPRREGNWFSSSGGAARAAPVCWVRIRDCLNGDCHRCGCVPASCRCAPSAGVLLSVRELSGHGLAFPLTVTVTVKGVCPLRVAARGAPACSFRPRAGRSGRDAALNGDCHR